MATASTVGSEREPWERTETKLVRPFKSTEDYLDDVALRLYGDSEFLTEHLIQVESVDFERLGVALRLAKPPKGFEDMVGVGLDELRLIVSIEDRTLKQAVVLRSVALGEVNDGMLELDDAKDAVSWSGEIRVHVAVVLAKRRKLVVGLAHRVGSWVARKTFSIARTRDTASLNIQPVDEAWFQARGLPPSTTYFVEILDTDLNQTCDQFPQLVHVYISKTLNATLSREQESPTTRALVKMIYVDVVSSVLTVGYSNLKGDVLASSILSVVAGRLSRATGFGEKKLVEYATENNGTQLKAIVQAEAELTKNMIAALGRRSG